MSRRGAINCLSAMDFISACTDYEPAYYCQGSCSILCKWGEVPSSVLAPGYIPGIVDYVERLKAAGEISVKWLVYAARSGHDQQV